MISSVFGSASGTDSDYIIKHSTWYQFPCVTHKNVSYFRLWYWLTLTHLPLQPHICVGELCQHWLRLWLVACSAPSHYLNQCWLIVIWTLRNKLLWNLNRNTKFFLHENAFENVVWEMAAILARGRGVKGLSRYDEVLIAGRAGYRCVVCHVRWVMELPMVFIIKIITW